MSVATSAQRSLGRFELLRELGRGAQATVWLAHDPRLDREVAVKLLDTSADKLSVSEWLHEARAVSRLAHPHIVPVFEADEALGQPYMVFEYVEGPTLAQARRQRKEWPAREAVTLMLGVLDALATAHAQGIVHRDLKPSNVLLGGDGRPRVMDFGIAARVGKKGKAQAEGHIVGTPGYISPEAARGEAPAPCMDVFAAGVMLGELLAGAALMHERDPLRALARVQTEDLALPDALQVDAQLRGIVQRALSRDSAMRYDDAAAMHAALQAWLTPAEDASDGAGSGNGTIDFLLRRMRHKSDFPALSASVVRIQRSATSDTESLGELAHEILKDVALTNKLLRMVNTAHFSQAAGGGVSTVTRAVALVGFAGIRNMALSVILLEHMGDRAHAALLKEEFLRALMSGILASELTTQTRESEDAFLGSMFQNLGRLLAEYYFPEEALQIRQLSPPGDPTPGGRDIAAKRVLGLTFDELGQGIARAWGLPDGLQRAMRAPSAATPPRSIDNAEERQRWLGRAAAALADSLMLNESAGQQEALLATAGQYAPALGLQAKDMVAAVQAARTRVTQLAQAMGVHVAAGSPARRLMESTTRDASAAAALADAPTVAQARTGRAKPGRQANAAVAASTASLQHGLQDVQRALGAGGMSLNDTLQVVMRAMQQALDFRQVVFCLRDARSGLLTGRMGIGADADTDAMSRLFQVDVKPGRSADLFATLCTKGADTLIANAGASNVWARLPVWYRDRYRAQTFLLLPMMHKGSAFGLIYADKEQAGSIVLEDGELLLLQALRDQAVAAFTRIGAR